MLPRVSSTPICRMTNRTAVHATMARTRAAARRFRRMQFLLMSIFVPTRTMARVFSHDIVARGTARAVRSHCFARQRGDGRAKRSEEHTSELQSRVDISYAVFCLKKK